MNICKKLLSGTISAIMAFSFLAYPISEQFGNSVENVIVAHAENKTDFNLDMYIADCIVSEEKGMKRTINSQLNCDSPATTLSNDMRSNVLFQASIGAWKVATFEPGNISEDMLNQIEYYETIILKSVRAQVSSEQSILTHGENALSNGKKTWSTFKSIVQLNEGAKEYALIKDTFDLSQFTKDDRKKMMGYVKDAFKENNLWLDGVSAFTDMLEVGTDMTELSVDYFETLCAYIECYQMSSEMKSVVEDMNLLQIQYNIMFNDAYFTQALANVYKACQSYEFALSTGVQHTAQKTTSKIIGIFADDMFNSIMNSNVALFSINIGRNIGKNISNMLFSTDSICELYYQMNCMSNYEKLAKMTVKYEMEQYKNSRTSSNAKKLLFALDIYYNTFDYSCELAQSFADKVCKSPGSVFIPGNDDGRYENFSKAVNNIRSGAASAHSDIYTRFLYDLEYDYPEIYMDYINKGIFNSVTCVSSVEFERESVEWGLGDSIYFHKYAHVNPSHAYDKSIRYTSSNTNVVTYLNGRVYVKKAGTAVITATSNDGELTDQMTVTVVNGHGKDSNGYISDTVSELVNTIGYIAPISYHIDENTILTENVVYDGNVYLSADIDLNAHKLTVVGNLYQTSGTMTINNGTLNVTGDYRIENEDFDNTGELSYDSSIGSLYMGNNKDVVKISGSFITRSSKWTKSSWSTGDNYFHAGKMYIGGDLYQYGEGNFICENNHTVIFTGDKTHLVSFENPYSHLNFIDFEDNARIKFLTNTSPFRLFEDIEIDGDICFVKDSGGRNNELDLDGKRMTVNGNLY